MQRSQSLLRGFRRRLSEAHTPSPGVASPPPHLSDDELVPEGAEVGLMLLAAFGDQGLEEDTIWIQTQLLDV